MGETGGLPVRVTADGSPGRTIPPDFTGLSFERGPLNAGNAGVTGYMFSPQSQSLVTLIRNLGLGTLRIGGGSVDESPPTGTGSDGTGGIDRLFEFARLTGVKIIYSFRLLNPADRPVTGLSEITEQIAGHIWKQHSERLSSFAIGNEPDWHSFHSSSGRVRDPAITEQVPGVPGSAYPSFLTAWRRLARAVTGAAPGALLSGPDTGDYGTGTFTPEPGHGVSWTEAFAADEADTGRLAEITQHYYVGAGPGRSRARHAIANMLSPAWVTGTQPGPQPKRTSFIPYPRLYASHVAPAVAAAGLPCRLTECNDYLVGVRGASNAFAAALWALDCLHWWAASGAAGVCFHNKQWLWTAAIVPGNGPGRYAATPKGSAIRAFTLGSAGRPRPVAVDNPGGLNLTAYWVSGELNDYITVINKTYGRDAAGADITIDASPGPGGAQVIMLAAARPGDVGSAGATLGGVPVTGNEPWDGSWDSLPAGAPVRLAVPAATAAVVRISRG